MAITTEQLNRIKAAMGGDPHGIVCGWIGGARSGEVVISHRDGDEAEVDAVREFYRVMGDIVLGHDTGLAEVGVSGGRLIASREQAIAYIVGLLLGSSDGVVVDADWRVAVSALCRVANMVMQCDPVTGGS